MIIRGILIIDTIKPLIKTSYSRKCISKMIISKCDFSPPENAWDRWMKHLHKNNCHLVYGSRYSSKLTPVCCELLSFDFVVSINWLNCNQLKIINLLILMSYNPGSYNFMSLSSKKRDDNALSLLFIKKLSENKIKK